MSSQEIRRAFLNYFKKHGHREVPSSSVVPHEDPTLLFNNAGMNQFKDVFTGKAKRDYKRAATSQKCIRVGGKHNDLDNVGHTSRHLTFFEMLGNFSFGDYFKEEAIAYGYEVATTIFGFAKKDLWITVYEEDDEAFDLWQKWVAKERIVRMGKKDNFWAMGDTGPCGPCSELYIDRGSHYGNASSPKDDITGERFLEFWNLVFMEFDRSADGTLTKLPMPSIDTGSGLERVISLMIKKDNVFETDILRSLIAEVENVSRKKYEGELKPAFHVIADHLRTLSFAIADGAQPSNLDRGYVLRKLLRRAVRYGKLLGMQEPFLASLLPRLIDEMGEDYPELNTAKARIEEILAAEEEGFLRTLKRGGNILSNVMSKALENPLREITGEEAFKLKDTYGFPLEEIMLIAKDADLTVNLESYELLEERAKERSRGAREVIQAKAPEEFYKEVLSTHGPCEFVGYDHLKTESTILAIFSEGEFVDQLLEGQEAQIFLNKTPFYAEKGGQIFDTGTLHHHKAHFTVTNCQNPFPGVIAHFGKLERGVLIPSEPITASVDSARRTLIANHHTATHLLHWALQQVLGAHIKQAGSLVEPDRLRFDFNHHKNVSREELQQIEDLVNEKIRENKSVETYEISYEEAQKKPEIKQFFGDKYGEKVRLVDIDYSKELCGGTHAAHLGGIGLFKIIKESSIAAGVRRIEAVTGKSAEEFVRTQEDLLHAASHRLKTTTAGLLAGIDHLEEENRKLTQKIKTLKSHELARIAQNAEVEEIGKIPFFTGQFAAELEPQDLMSLADEIIKRHPSLVLILAHAAPDKCQLLIRVTQDLTRQGITALEFIKELAPLIGGGGGGKPESAQAGGKRPEGIPEAFTKAKELLTIKR
jgi:alanyl-tRNA synthetase